jgi:predicted enzyme related to lactoylglutathione lyase
MTSGIRTIIYPVNDLEKAKAVFTALLGVAPAQDAPYYVGYQVDGQDIGLDPNGHAQGMTGPVAYVQVDDIEASVRALADAGAAEQRPITDVGGGRRIAVMKDADGNPIGLLQDPK